jgi:hypothetical protein
MFVESRRRDAVLSSNLRSPALPGTCARGKCRLRSAQREVLM